MNPLPITTHIFVQGKGGVGKTTVSRALAERFASEDLETLWMCFEDPLQPPDQIAPRKMRPRLSHFNCQSFLAFQEYIELKVPIPKMAKALLGNKAIEALAKAAPGVKELAMLGKIWHERLHFDRVVCDMPSTGFGLALFQSLDSFSKLFKAGSLHRDVEEMHAYFSSPEKITHLIVTIPEEGPLQEAVELRDHLKKFFPKCPVETWMNRCMPGLDLATLHPAKDFPLVTNDPAVHAEAKRYRQQELLRPLEWESRIGRLFEESVDGKVAL